MAILEDVKILLGIKDDVEDDKLNLIIRMTEGRLVGMLPETITAVPPELQYIVTEVTVKRYNRIGAEGMVSESVEGRSNTFQLNDFDEYLSVISDYYLDDNQNVKKGVATFY